MIGHTPPVPLLLRTSLSLSLALLLPPRGSRVFPLSLFLWWKKGVPFESRDNTRRVLSIIREGERERCGNSRRFRAVIFARKKYRFHPSAFGSREFYWYVRSGCRAAVSQPPPINHYKYFGTGFPSVSPYRGYKLRRQRIPLSSRDDGSERHLFPQIYTAARKTFRSAVSNDRDG